MNLRKKLILIIMAVAILPMVFVGTLGYYNARTALECLQMAALQSITEFKAKVIEDFIVDQKNHVRIAQLRPNIKKYASILVGLSGDVSSPLHATAVDELDRTLKMYQPVYNYINVMLANPHGDIVYELNRSSASGAIKNSLPGLWENAFEEGEKEVYVSDIFFSKTRVDQYSVLVTAPISNIEEIYLGVIVFEIDMMSIFKRIQNLTGMGKTGETIIARQEKGAVLFLNPLRHDPSAALVRKAYPGESQTISFHKALEGDVGCGFSLDYRDREVIVAWRNIPIVNWAMVAKIDVSEALEPATTLRNFVFILIIAVIILSIFLALIVAKSICEPIQMLQKGTEEIGRGNLDHRLDTHTKDEIGQLGRSFNDMAQKLTRVTASRDDLNREINKRRKAEKELKRSMGALDERVKELNCLFEISRLVEKRKLTLDEILQGIVDLVPPAWRYPDMTCAKISLNGGTFKTENFIKRSWQLVSDIIVHNVPSGKLVVGFRDQRPGNDDSPFLKEEGILLNVIAERVGRIIERRWAQEALLKSEEKFRELMENMHSGVAVYEAVAGGEDFEIKDFNRGGEKIEKIAREKSNRSPDNRCFPWHKGSWNLRCLSKCLEDR